jgi:TIR domain
MARIFISYRRADSGAWAGRLHDRLREHFGRDDIFMDIDTIEPGLDFTEVIERTVGSCDVLIALVGRQWLTSTDAAGQRRLDDPEDLVRREIATALRRNIRVIPVLIQDISMPRAADLPDDLQLLTRRNAVDLSDTHFHRDADQLMVVLDRVLGVTPSPASPAETGPPHVLPPVRSSYLRSWRFWGLAGLIVAGMAFIVAVSVVPLVRVPTSSSPRTLAPESPPPPSETSPSPQPPSPTSKVPAQAATAEKEPNDDIGNATFITEGTTVRGAIATPQDRDFFTFTVSSSKTRVILRKQFYAWVDVYNDVENRIAWGSEAGDQTISFPFESTPGRFYYILVKPGSSGRGDYELVVRKE